MLRTTLAVTSLLLALAACGDAESELPGSGDAVDDLSAVTIEGEVGTKPEVTWEHQLVADEVDTEVVVEGDGPEIAEGDQVFSRLWIGNGFSKQEVYSTFGAKTDPVAYTIGGQDLPPVIYDALEGVPLGSRVAIAAPPEDAFGESGNASLGIGNGDSVIFIVDALSQLPSGPSGEDREPAAWAPEVVFEDDVPTSLDFTGTPEPTDSLRSTTLIAGDGEKTKKGDTIYVDYLGQVFGGKKPFDSSYARGEPFSLTLGAGQVVKGWEQGLTGVPVGSRVILAIPPDLGYGEEGNKDAGISGTDTLYFVVDVLAAL